MSNEIQKRAQRLGLVVHAREDIVAAIDAAFGAVRWDGAPAREAVARAGMIVAQLGAHPDLMEAWLLAGEAMAGRAAASAVRG